MLLLPVVIAGALVLGSGHGPARAAAAESTVNATSAASARTQEPPTPPAPPVPPTPRRAPSAPTPLRCHRRCRHHLRRPQPPCRRSARAAGASAKPGQNVNMQIELTITETTGTTPETKIVSMLAADASWGRVRSQGSARPNATAGFDAVVLNVDARPTILNADVVAPRAHRGGTCRRWPRSRAPPTSSGRRACIRAST